MPDPKPSNESNHVPEQPRRRPSPRSSSADASPGSRNRVAGQRAKARREPDGADLDESAGTETGADASTDPDDSAAAATTRVRLPRLPRRSPGTNRRRVPLAISAALLVVFAATAVVLGLRLYQGRASAANSAAVLRIVPRYASQVLSFDYRHLDSNSAAARPLLSGAYRKDYDQSMTSHAAAWKKYHYVVTSKIASAGVSRSSGSKVVVVASVDQSVSAGTKKSGTAQDLIRLRFTLERQHGSWLLTKLDSL